MLLTLYCIMMDYNANNILNVNKYILILYATQTVFIYNVKGLSEHISAPNKLIAYSTKNKKTSIYSSEKHCLIIYCIYHLDIWEDLCNIVKNLSYNTVISFYINRITSQLIPMEYKMTVIVHCLWLKNFDDQYEKKRFKLYN